MRRIFRAGSGKTTVVLSVFAISSSWGVEKLAVIGPRSSFMPWEEEFYAAPQEAT